jgi:hypothetical protein
VVIVFLSLPFLSLVINRSLFLLWGVSVIDVGILIRGRVTVLANIIVFWKVEALEQASESAVSSYIIFIIVILSIVSYDTGTNTHPYIYSPPQNIQDHLLP